LSDPLIEGAEPELRDRFERSLGQVFSQSKPKGMLVSARIRMRSTALGACRIDLRLDFFTSSAVDGT